MSSLIKTMFGRVGLDGTFKIKKDLNGLNFSLFFDWNENQRLKEITLRSAVIDPAQFNSILTKAFRNDLHLISEDYGPPLMGNPMPKTRQVGDGATLNSHLWHVGSGTLLMGVAKDQGKLHLSISFLEKRINPVPN